MLTFFACLSLDGSQQRENTLAATLINACEGCPIGMASGQQRGTNMSAELAHAFSDLAFRTPNRLITLAPLPPENNLERR